MITDAVTPAYKGDSTDVTDTYAEPTFATIPNVPPLDEKKAVDGEKLFRFYRPLPPKSAGIALELRKKVLGIYDKGKAGTVVETATDLVDKVTGEIYSSEIGSAFFIGQGS